MNIETANRLLKYRKDNNLSQEALAQKLGISRQAVSKWERAEASPDTDNLVELAKIYNVSLDELINGLEQEGSQTKGTQDKTNNEEYDEDAKEYVNISTKGIHVKDKDGSEVHVGWNGIHITDKSSNTEIKNDHVWCNGEEYSLDDYKCEFGHNEFPIGVIIAIGYIIYCTFTGLWHPTWLVFLLIPIISTFITAVKKRNANYFAYPVVTSLIFLSYGFIYDVWHPTWVVFITIPLYYSLVGYINARKKYRKKKKEQKQQQEEQEQQDNND